jgi:hypothetical protein
MLAVIGLGDSVTGFEAASPPTAVAPWAATPARAFQLTTAGLLFRRLLKG